MGKQVMLNDRVASKLDILRREELNEASYSKAIEYLLELYEEDNPRISLFNKRTAQIQAEFPELHGIAEYFRVISIKLLNKQSKISLDEVETRFRKTMNEVITGEEDGRTQDF